jgi:hypothetical protein
VSTSAHTGVAPAQPRAAVRLALTASPGGPAEACSLYSAALLKSAYGTVDGCVSALRSGGTADSVKFISSKKSGTTATVVAVPSGGPSSGEKLTYTLVLADHGWLLDTVKSNVPVGP